MNIALIFFDLTYVPIIFYNHEGARLGAEAIKETQTRLNALLDFAINSESVVPDNPIYRALSERDTYQNFMPPERQSLYELYLNGRKFS